MKKKGGRFVTIVGDRPNPTLFTLAGMIWRYSQGKVGAGFPYCLAITDTSTAQVSKDMAQVTELVEGGKLKTLLDDRRFELTSQGIKDFVEASMSHRAKGKLVLEVRKE